MRHFICHGTAGLALLWPSAVPAAAAPSWDAPPPQHKTAQFWRSHWSQRGLTNCHPACKSRFRVKPLPPGFAARHAGGQTLALGFGGSSSICAAASRGPALGAIPAPDPQQRFVPVTPLLADPP